MVAEWGMSSRVGPMAWGSAGQVFLGEDLIHTRDYSDETARVIDEEVEKILRGQEDRCRVTLRENRHGLDLVARALLEYETIDGSEVNRLIDVSRNTSLHDEGSPGAGDESANGDNNGDDKSGDTPASLLAPPTPPT
jgi:cell division protease FtsH